MIRCFLLSLILFISEAIRFSNQDMKLFDSCLDHGGTILRIETLIMDPNKTNALVVCSCSLFHAKSNHSKLCDHVDTGPDGRDIISMSALEIQRAFGIDVDLSELLFEFISGHLTARLPNQR